MFELDLHTLPYTLINIHFVEDGIDILNLGFNIVYQSAPTQPPTIDANEGVHAYSISLARTHAHVHTYEKIFEAKLSSLYASYIM